MARQRCSQCDLALSRCICHWVRPVANRIPVIVLQDTRESDHALGTARIARLGLENFTLIPLSPGKIESEQSQLNGALPAEAVLVYPGDDAMPVGTYDPVSPVTGKQNKNHHRSQESALVFIDATWRRSKRILLEHPILQQLPRYQLSHPPPTRYTLRKAPGPDALSTLEAAVEVLACVDRPRRDDYRRLLAVMDQMIDYQVRAMGERAFLNNYWRKHSVSPLS